MKQEEYDYLQKQISVLYESTKYKDYSSKEREGAKKFCLATKSLLKSYFERNNQ